MSLRGRGLGTLPYWLIVATLFVLGILALPSIGWLLIATALILAVVGGVRSYPSIIVPVCIGFLGLVVAYLLFAPGLCVGSAASGAGGPGGIETSCTSLAFIPLGGENWILFLIAGPLIAVGAAVLARRSMRPRID
jgi:hypothetical protein